MFDFLGQTQYTKPEFLWYFQKVSGEPNILNRQRIFDLCPGWYEVKMSSGIVEFRGSFELNSEYL